MALAVSKPNEVLKWPDNLFGLFKTAYCQKQLYCFNVFMTWHIRKPHTSHIRASRYVHLKSTTPSVGAYILPCKIVHRISSQ